MIFMIMLCCLGWVVLLFCFLLVLLWGTAGSVSVGCAVVGFM